MAKSKKGLSNDNLTLDRMEDKAREAALNEAISKIEKSYGKGTIMKLSDRPKTDIGVIRTGAINLDLALGVGGLPRGRIIEIYGHESSGKTTLALEAIAEAQKEGGYAAFIDAEHALDVEYAKALGVNIDDLLMSQPDDGEQALEILEQLVRSNALDIIVVDSVAALVPRAEIEGLMGDAHVGILARLMSQALRKLTPAVSKSNTTVIFLNQLRQKIGVYGNPDVTTGGIALKFYSSVRLEIKRLETIYDKEEPIGNRVRVKVVKNKVAPPFKRVEFEIYYGKGISKLGTMIQTALDTGIITRSGAWYYFGDLRLGQGKENATIYVKENPELQSEIEEKLMLSFENFNSSDDDDEELEILDESEEI